MKKDSKHTISNRKADHLEICISQNVDFKHLGTGFNSIQLMHCALPEMNLDDVDTSTTFLGKQLSMPLVITGMTGGFAQAERVNRLLAKTCNDHSIALGLGSQRQAMENERYIKSFRAAREEAPDIPLIGNIGAAQITGPQGIEYVQQILNIVHIDALAVHLNPLQEALQPEGDTNFSGVLNALQELEEEFTIPIIVKETGAGISAEVAAKLLQIGIRYIDVSGAGGTSWAAVEHFRGAIPHLAEKFREWGIPTALCLKELKDIPNLSIIASGGIRDGVDMAKALVLGADLAGAAAPFLHALFAPEGNMLDTMVEQWRQQLRLAMFLTGCKHIEELASVRYFSTEGFKKE